MVETYKDGGLGDNDEDAKKIKEAERDVVLQINRDKRKPNKERRPPTLPPPPHVVTVGTWGVTTSPTNADTSIAGPSHQPGFYKPLGPCFNCYEVGLLKANSPKLRRPQYPLYSRHDIVIDSVCGEVTCSSFNNTCVTVCGDVCSSSSNNTCVTACGNVSNYSYNNACITVYRNVSNSSCNKVVSSVCRSEVVKVTACEMLSSNYYTTGHCIVVVDSTSTVNVPQSLPQFSQVLLLMLVLI